MRKWAAAESERTLRSVSSFELTHDCDRENFVNDGRGRLPGAGEWKELELAKAAEEIGTEADGGGVRWCNCAGAGEVETLFGRAFLPLFLLVDDFDIGGCEPGAGLALLDFMGVVGKLAGIGISERASPSEA